MRKTSTLFFFYWEFFLRLYKNWKDRLLQSHRNGTRMDIDQPKSDFYFKILNRIGSRMRLWQFPFLPVRSYVQKSGTILSSGKFQLRNTYLVKSSIKSNDRRRFIICADLGDIYGGLGCCLSLLAPCWNYALRTNRTLVIDWRGNPYTRHDPEINLFPLLFEELKEDEIGVPCIADDSLTEFIFSQPILGPAEPLQQSWRVDQLPSGGLIEICYEHLMYFCRDVEFPTMIPTVNVLFGIRRKQKGLDFESLKTLYSSLKPKQQWREIIQTFYDKNMSSGPTIGIHIRHGNGEENFNSHFFGRQIQNFDEFVYDICAKIIKHGKTRYENKFKVFLCTDSDIAVDAFKQKFPNLVTREIWRPPPNAGINFDHADQHPNGPAHVAAEALIDMYLLAKCDSVLITRDTEFSSHIPYIMEKPNSIFLDHRAVSKI